MCRRRDCVEALLTTTGRQFCRKTENAAGYSRLRPKALRRTRAGLGNAAAGALSPDGGVMDP
jgi:hypothetical protein